MIRRYFERRAREALEKALRDAQIDVKAVVERLDRLESQWRLVGNEWADTYEKLDRLRARLAARERSEAKQANGEEVTDWNAKILERRRRGLGG